VHGIMARVQDAWAKHGRPGAPRFIATLPCAFGRDTQQQVEESIAHYYAGGPSGGGADRQARPSPTSVEAVREIIAIQTELGTDEIIFRPAKLGADQVDLLAKAVS